MKKIKLDIWERVQIAGLLKNEKGNLARVRKILRVLDVLELSEKEQKEINFETIIANTSSGVRESYKWDENVSYKLEFEDADWDILKSVVLAYNNWSVDKKVVEMLDKIEEG